MLHQLLKLRTTYVHNSLEKKLLDQIRKVSTREHYGSLLRLLYGYYASIETEIDRFVNSGNVDLYDRRRKAHLLRTDITDCTTADSIPLCHQLPDIGSFSSAIGALYVMEGSTLGGRIIAGMIAKQLAPYSPPLSFFAGYGDKTEMMWLSLKEVLSQPFGEAEQQEILRAASQTFTTFKTWIEENVAS